MPSGIYNHKPLTKKWKENISKAKKGKIPKNISLIAGWNKGKHIQFNNSLEVWRKNGHTSWNDGIKGYKTKPASEERKLKISITNSGENNYWWNPNREFLEENKHNDPVYKQWRKQVWLRDDFMCKISNFDCKGRIEAHHTLGWRSYPELRYKINNGITLCHAHHPFKRAEEKRLAPIFRELVSVSN